MGAGAYVSLAIRANKLIMIVSPKALWEILVEPIAYDGVVIGIGSIVPFQAGAHIKGNLQSKSTTRERDAL